MKKTKKLVAVLCMMASLSANLILPIGASASMPTLSEVDFDNITINQTALNNATDHNARNNSLPGIVMSGHNYQTIPGTDKIWATELISLAHAPDVTVPTDDRALKIKLNPNTYTATPKFRIDGDIAGKKVVYDFNIMYDGISNAHTLSFQLYNANGKTDAEKYLDRSITQIYDNGGNKMKFTLGYTNKDYVFNLNEWQNIKIVFDCTDITDMEKCTATVYLNGNQVAFWTFKDRAVPAFTQFNNLYFICNGADKNYAERNIYIDNWKQYIISGNEEAGIRMTNYDGASFMNGTDIYFKSDVFVEDGDDFVPINKVEYYDNGELVGTVTQDPFKFYYHAQTAGKHTITAKAYNELDVYPVAEASTYFTVEPLYYENNLMLENFDYSDDYENAETVKNSSDVVVGVNWTDYAGSGAVWKVRGNHEAVEIDKLHGKSIKLGGVNPHSLGVWKGEEDDSLRSGDFKISGEFYVPESIGSNNEIFLINTKRADVIPVRIHGSNMTAVDGGETISNFIAQKWYKFDIVSRIKGTTGYYTLYVNGRQVSRKTTQYMDSFNYVKFINAWNTNYMVFDNLSVSSIEYGETPEIIAEDGKLTVSAPISNNDEDMMIVGVYNAETGALKDVAIGEFNSDNGMSAVAMNNFDAAADFAKVFIWDKSSLMPVSGVTDSRTN